MRVDDQAGRLADDEEAGAKVPGPGPGFPVGVYGAGGDGAEVQGCGAEGAEGVDHCASALTLTLTLTLTLI